MPLSVLGIAIKTAIQALRRLFYTNVQGKLNSKQECVCIENTFFIQALPQTFAIRNEITFSAR
jgi:hypothetical protein